MDIGSGVVVIKSISQAKGHRFKSLSISDPTLPIFDHLPFRFCVTRPDHRYSSQHSDNKLYLGPVFQCREHYLRKSLYNMKYVLVKI